MTNPSDEARRALREARERGTGRTGAPERRLTHGLGQAAAGAATEPTSSRADTTAELDEGVGEKTGAAEKAGAVAEVTAGAASEPTSSQADATTEAEEEPQAYDGAKAESRAKAGMAAEAVDTVARSEEGRRARPSDAARAALRRAVSGGHGPRTDVDSETTATTPAPEAEGPGAGQQTPRPADVAREALRAARRERSRPTPAPATPVTETTRTPRHPARNDASAVRVRAMRELLANAFKMPPDLADTDEPDSPDESSGGPRPAPRRRTAPDPATRATAAEPDSPDESSGGPRPAPRRRTAPDAAARATAAEPESRDESSGRPARPAAPRRTAAHSATRSDVTPTPPARTAAHSATRSDVTPTPPARDAAHASRARDAAPTPPARDATSTPHVPRSMAAPSRDGELRRTFPAFPARGSGEGGFARTWWGNAWVAALEQGALDGKRLARGRGYAEQGHVDAITVTPGLVLAYVKGSRPRPYRVQVRLRTLDDADWERFLDVAAERPGHIAALLDKEMPHSLAECGVPLLPGPGELDPRCSCPDSGHPCKHAAALCYQTARLLDADPFVLLLLRGRGERELLDALSRLSAARAARAAQDQGPAPLPGVRASEALAPRRLPPLPPPLPVPPHPEQPPVYPAAPGGPDPFALDQLATDAAARAHALLGTGRDPLAELTLWQDAVRLAAARPGSGLTAGTRALYADLAAACDRTPADLARAVAAWRQGGAEGLAVLEEPWDPPAGRFDRARPLLLAADLPAFRPWRNHLTHPRGHVQLRLGRDGLWYTYESEPGQEDWWPRGTPDLDPVGALTGLGGPVEP
ncbi:SWIM zinc finger family protein [Streptomyces sp. NPDC003635]